MSISRRLRIMTNKLLPSGTRRRRYYDLVFMAFRIIHNEGLGTFLHKFMNYLRYATGITRYSAKKPEAVGDYAQFYESVLASSSHPSPEYVPLDEKSAALSDPPVKLIAFYLPQYHPIPENDAWWGKGFTEWTNVSKAVPQFVGHYQPRLPGELGFYDLRVPDIQRRQIALARQYGIHGFCFYYYWFAGKRLLEKPIEQFLADRSMDFPFCLCWANENWTRTWDGLESQVLIAQNYSPGDDLKFIESIAPALLDPRYIRVGGRPLLIVYSVSRLPDPQATAEVWRSYCRQAGIGDLYMVVAQTLGVTDPRPYGFDAAVQFPPNNMHATDITKSVRLLNTGYSGTVYDYRTLVDSQVSNRDMLPFELFYTTSPGWDNESRRPGRGYTYTFSTPREYARWLRNICLRTIKEKGPEKQIVFINAWNEWSESAYLEPDRRYGYAYLQATADVLRSLGSIEPSGLITHNDIFHSDIRKTSNTAVILHLFYPELWDEFCSYLKVLGSDFDLFVSIPVNVTMSEEKIRQRYPHAYIYRCENRGRDIAPFLKIFSCIYPLQYSYICKIHTKKTPTRQDGTDWRQNMCTKLLESNQTVSRIKDTLNRSDIGIVAPSGHVLSSKQFMGDNRPKFKWLCTSAGLDNISKSEFTFVGGSMFWFKPSVFHLLNNFPVNDTSFEPEIGQKDGTLAHTFERFFGLLVAANDLKITEVNHGIFLDVLRTNGSKTYRFAL
jgi:lipopolysaccharide biosynthesis protein